jgi:hypothetical protein
LTFLLVGFQLTEEKLIEVVYEGNKRYDEQKQTDKETLTLTISEVTQTKFHKYLTATGFLQLIGEYQDSWTFDESVLFEPLEEPDMPDPYAHLKTQLSSFGILFEKNNFELYDVHKFKQLLSLEDPKLGKVSGGTDIILAPHGYSTKSTLNSVRVNGCVFFELKSTFSSPSESSIAKEEKKKKAVSPKSKSTSSTAVTKLSTDESESKKELTPKNLYQAELELICGFYHGNQTVLVVLTNLNSPSFAFTLNYNEPHRSFNIITYEDLTLEQMGWLVRHHLDANCKKDNTYQLPQDPDANLNESEKLMKVFKRMKVSAPELSLDYEHFMELLELTEDRSTERLQAVNQFFYSMDHSDSYLSMFS